jgi:hypothetical protein
MKVVRFRKPRAMPRRCSSLPFSDRWVRCWCRGVRSRPDIRSALLEGETQREEFGQDLRDAGAEGVDDGLHQRATSLHHARAFMDEFVQSYNHEHHHTGIGLHTAADVHYGLAGAKAVARNQVLAQVRATHPERFATETVVDLLVTGDSGHRVVPSVGSA